MSAIVVKARCLASDPDKEVPEYTIIARGVGERFVGIEGDIEKWEAFFIETLVMEREKVVMPTMIHAEKGTMLNFVGVIQSIWWEHEDKYKIVSQEGDIGHVPYDKNMVY